MAKGSWIRINAVEAHLDATTVNSIIKDGLVRKAVSITKRPDVRQAIGEELLEIVTPFVPMRPLEKGGGTLRSSGRATDDGRLYWTAINKRGENYAGYVYDPAGTRWPTGKYNNPSTDYTYPRWMKHVQPDTDKWVTFINKVTPIIKEAFKDE